MRTEAIIRGEKYREDRDHAWAVRKKSGPRRWNLQSLLTVSITVPCIKQEAFKTSASGGSSSFVDCVIVLHVHRNYFGKSLEMVINKGVGTRHVNLSK